MNKNDSKNIGEKGFTLLEMLIVLTLVSILLSTVFGILFVVVRQQARIYRIIETRRQGDTILNFMKEKIVRATTIRNPVAVPPNPVYHPQCTSSIPSYTPASPQNFVLEDSSGQYYRFYLSGNNILYNESPGAITTAINNNKVTISALTIECLLKSSSTTPIVQFTYTVTFNDITPSEEEGTQTLTYRSKVQLR